MTTAVQKPTRRPHFQAASELALALVSISIVIGFGRVFNDRSFVLPLLTVVVATHLYLALVRRRGWGIAVSGGVGIAGLVLLCTYLFFASSTRALLPSIDTLTQARDALQTSYNTFQNVTAPAPAESGFLLACAIALFFAVFLADWAAFRLWSPWEAVVPATTLFVFCSLLGSAVGRIPATAVFVATALGFILVHSVAKRETSAGWLSSDIERGSRALLRVGAILGLVAVVVGMFVGPSLPGADSDPYFCLSKCADNNHTGDRFTISPLVEIQSRLVTQANVEFFTVKSPVRAYWRMTSLDTFDGNSWRSKGKFTLADGDLDAPVPPTETNLVEQQYRIEALQRLWIPAAFLPVSVSEDARARYQSDSSTLIVDTELSDSDGLDYTVKSKIPNFTAEQLRGADTSVPSDISDRYLGLPSDFSQKAETAAKEVTDGQSSNFDKALALQDWFQTNFQYTLQIPPGHSDRAIDDFLDRKAGYCEQFAGTMAAMARSLGIPSRVAVGFTWGNVDPNDPNLYHVMGENAHAWPELYLGQYGWVSFEPTPNRGDPNTAGYTGVTPAQFSQTDGPTTSTASTTSTTNPASPTSTVAPTPLSGLDLPSSLDTSTESANRSFLDRWGTRTLVVAGTLVVAFWLYVLVLALIPRRRRRSRREHARDPSSQVRVAWEESVEDLSLVGVTRVGAETNDEFARRASGQLPETTHAITDLATDADAAMYARDLVDPGAAERARKDATSISRAVRSRTSAAQRIRRLLDPRQLRTGDRQRPTRHRATSSR